MKVKVITRARVMTYLSLDVLGEGHHKGKGHDISR